MLYESSAAGTIDTVVEDHVDIDGKFYYRLPCKGKADPKKVHEKEAQPTRDSTVQLGMHIGTEIDTV